MMNLELDGENISIEQSSPSDNTRLLDQDNFYPADGKVIPMVAAVAGQNTGNYFDQDNFYPANGIRKKRRADRRENRQKLKDARLVKKQAKTNEIQSRADLNKSLGQEKQSDIELAKALAPTPSTDNEKKSVGLSKNTKIAIGAVGGLVLIVGIYFLVKKNK